MTRLQGKVAIITGAASGIGRRTAIRMAAEGAHVVGGDLNGDGGREVAELCRAEGRDADFVTTDVTVEDDVAGLMDLAVRRFGRIDILFNNAGASGAIGPIETTPVEDWDRTQNIVLRSAFLGMKHVVPYMKKQRRGSIISTSSIAGLRGYAGLHAYCAAKAGLVNMTRSAAVELGEWGIRVNCICPGDIITPMRSGGLSQEEMERELAKHQPIGRAGRADDIASAALFFASDEAEWVTGVSIAVDGGATTGVWEFGQNSDIAHVLKPGFLEPSFIREQRKAAAAAAGTA